MNNFWFAFGLAWIEMLLLHVALSLLGVFSVVPPILTYFIYRKRTKNRHTQD